MWHFRSAPGILDRVLMPRHADQNQSLKNRLGRQWPLASGVGAMIGVAGGVFLGPQISGMMGADTRSTFERQGALAYQFEVCDRQGNNCRVEARFKKRRDCLVYKIWGSSRCDCVQDRVDDCWLPFQGGPPAEKITCKVCPGPNGCSTMVTSKCTKMP